jgi:hypothetical protein
MEDIQWDSSSRYCFRHVLVVLIQVMDETMATTKISSRTTLHGLFGFSKRYNFIFWLIFGIPFSSFIIHHLKSLDFHGTFCPEGRTGSAVPGECFTFRQTGRIQMGLRVHLATIIPASILVLIQFTPILRCGKFIQLHRFNGYLIIGLSIVSMVASLVMADRAFGGGVDLQCYFGLATIMFLGSMLVSLFQIWLVQIEQHRAWMLRAWFYVSRFLWREAPCLY